MIYKLTATDWQKEVIETVINSPNRFICLMAGRRAGKTFASRTAMVMDCLNKVGRKWWYVAPGYALAKEQFDSIAAHPALKSRIQKTRMQPFPVITFINGSSIAFRSFDRPRGLVGFGLDGCWCDEIQDFAGDHFWQVIRPLLSDRRGKLVISGQHRGTESWYYKELYSKGLEGKDGYRAWSIPSWFGLVFQSDAGKAELELAKQQVPKIVWDVEYACLPTANQAAVFRPEDLLSAKELGRNQPDVHMPQQGIAYMIGLDLGRIADPSAIVIMANNVVVHAEKRPLGERHEVGSAHIASLARRYNNAMVVVDSTGGATGGRKPKDEYIKLYRTKLPKIREFYWTYDSKKRIIESLCIALEQHKLVIPEVFAELHKELALYEYKLRANSRLEYSAPAGEHDDLVAALAMAWDQKKFIPGKGMGAMPEG